MNAVIDLNDQLFQHLNTFARDTPWLHGAATAFASYGVVLFGVLVLAAIWQARHAPDRTLAAALWAGVGTLVAVAVNQPIASLVAEPRPYATHPQALVLVARTTDWSFPSDHSVMAGACAVGLLIAARRLGVVAAMAALLMAVCRVYVGAHYPGDVLAGLLVGGVVVGLGWFLLRRPLVAATAWLRRVAVPGEWCAPRPEATRTSP